MIESLLLTQRTERYWSKCLLYQHKQPIFHVKEYDVQIL